MTEIVVNPDDSFEWMLKGFKRKVHEAGILTEHSGIDITRAHKPGANAKPRHCARGVVAPGNQNSIVMTAWYREAGERSVSRCWCGEGWSS